MPWEALGVNQVHPEPSQSMEPPAGTVDLSDLERAIEDPSTLSDVLIDQAPIGFALLDTDLRFVRVNRVLAAINGRSVEQHLGRSIHEVVPTVAPEVEAVMRGVLTSGTSVLDLHVRGETDADPGAGRDWLATIYRVERDGGVIGLAVVVVETAAQRRAEQRLRSLIDGLFTFVGLCTPDGTLVEANHTALAAAGLSAADVVGRPFWETYWWSYDPHVQHRLRDAIDRCRQGISSRFDARVRVADGHLITIDFQLVPLIEHGEVTALVPSGLDVTDRIRNTAQLTATATLARRLTAASTTERAVDVLLRHGAAAVDAAFVNIALVDRDSDQIEVSHPESLDGDIAARYAGPIDDPTPIADAVRNGRTVVVTGPQDHGGRYLAMYDDVLAAGLTTVMAVPLSASPGRPIGALGIGWAAPATADEAARARVFTVAQLAAQTFARTRDTDVRRDFVAELQRELLPRIPTVAGIDLAVDYLPSGDVLGFGGDWYDVIALDEHRTAMVVGDVAGHGVDAAARMTHLRSLLRALLETDPDLDTLLLRAGVPLTRDGFDFMATAAVAVVDTAASTLRHISAGHPPAVMMAPDGSVRTLAGGRSAALGCPAGPVVAPTEAFPVGSTLLLYSDGLIERRGETIDDGIDRLVGLLGSCSEPTATALVTATVRGLVGPAAQADDIAIVAARHRG